MTAVEFFDRTPIENIISSLTTIPDKIIFIGEKKLTEQFDSVYKSFLNKRNLKIEIAYQNINKNDINAIVTALSEIVEAEEECVFDLTGGGDLVLVAMGMVYQKYKGVKKIQMQRFNVNNGVVTDCDNDGTILYSGKPELSVEENIVLHGGVIRYKKDGEDRTYQWDLSEDFVRDIEMMWKICKKDPGYWNAQINVLEAMNAFSTDVNSLEVSVPVSNVREYMKLTGTKALSIRDLLETLNQHKLIYGYVDDGQVISFGYKNEQVKKCLTKAGMVLELKVLVVAMKLRHKDGKPYYTDAMNGVYIDWDGELHTSADEKKDTENEIDVVLMKGMTPIFISCKNGQVGMDELYKLETVTNRYGGVHAKKRLIATYLGKKSQSIEYFRQRAKDMDIKVIADVHTMSDDEFAREIKNLIEN